MNKHSRPKRSKGQVLLLSIMAAMPLLLIDLTTKAWMLNQGAALLNNKPLLLAWWPWQFPAVFSLALGAWLCILAIQVLVDTINQHYWPKEEIFFAAGLWGNGLNLLWYQGAVDFIPLQLGPVWLIFNIADCYLVLGFVWSMLSNDQPSPSLQPTPTSRKHDMQS